MFFADVVKLANTLDLGSSASAWGFKSLHPHHNKKVGLSHFFYCKACRT